MPAARVVLWVTSSGAIALLVRSWFIGPIPLAWAVVLLALYVTLTCLGWLFPQLEMYGDVVWHGLPGKQRAALSFDDGPHPDSTRKVLALLAAHGARASFFVVGRKVRLHPEVVREIHAAGHVIGIHGYVHERLYSFKSPSAIRRDIEATQLAVEEACGIRPPLGHVSPRVVAGARRANVTLVAWNVRALDGFARARSERVLRRVERGLRDGAIAILHDAAEKGGYQPAGVDALPAILETARARGLSLVGVDEFVAEDER
jgi:peptidoglycan/xylan/chitin deacetylase (PgdA/CDA1 family)